MQVTVIFTFFSTIPHSCPASDVTGTARCSPPCSLWGPPEVGPGPPSQAWGPHSQAWGPPGLWAPREDHRGADQGDLKADLQADPQEDLQVDPSSASRWPACS